MQRRLWWILVWGLVWAGTGTAQYQRGQLAVGIQMGVQYYEGDLRRSGYGPAVNFAVQYMPLPYFGLMLQSGYGELRDEVRMNAFYTPLMDAKISAMLMFFPTRRISPFVFGGGGGFRFRALKGDRKSPILNRNGRPLSGWAEVALAGAGAEILITPQWALIVSGDYHYTLSDALDGTLARNDTDGFFNARIGLLYRFGGDQDRDHDGIFDRFDRAPEHAEDVDGFQDEDGMPDLDNDRDGVPDDRDRAPNLAEDKDGFEDEDGIPDLDNDGDGIPDTMDLMPNQAEDFDGYQDEDGAPDPDNDGDGIEDVNDRAPNQAEDPDGFQDEDGIPDLDNDNDGIPDDEDGAPNEPETVNGYKDHDGIPDRVPWLKPGERRILQGVTFRSGSARLTSMSYQVLEKLAQELQKDTTMVIEIQGYTDSRGNDEANLRLSLKRANQVRWFLISKGVAPDRLIAVGYGESRPIAPNNTPEGRRANRRIEILRIDE